MYELLKTKEVLPNVQQGGFDLTGDTAPTEEIRMSLRDAAEAIERAAYWSARNSENPQAVGLLLLSEEVRKALYRI